MNGNHRPELQWIKRDLAPPVEDGLVAMADVAEPSPIRDLIAEVGIPTFGVATPHEDALLLLQTAAEVEHALMVQYLYALYSLRPDPEIDELRESLQTIAVQEMGHLMTVQNLLLVLGSSPYMSRQDISPQASIDPIPFTLEPLTRHSLAKYVAAESPILAPGDPDFVELQAIFEEARIASHTDVHRVGLIYAAIYWLFQSSDQPEPPWTTLPRQGFRPGWHVEEGDLHFGDVASGRQADLSEWGASVPHLIIDACDSRPKILQAIFLIAAQGEGFETLDGSHFERFRKAFRQLDALPQPPHLSVPVNPTIGSVQLEDPEREHNRISNQRTRQWAELFDQRYHILLLCLQHTFRYRRSDASENKIRVTLRNWSMQEMRKGIKLIAQEMTTQPRFEPGDSPLVDLAGPPFDLEGVDIDLPEGQLDVWRLHKRHNDDSLGFIEQILAVPDLSASATACLNGLKTASTARVEIINTQIAANGG